MSGQEAECPFACWIGETVWVNKFGKDSVQGLLLDITGGLLLIKTENKMIYYNMDQVQSITVKKKEKMSDPIPAAAQTVQPNYSEFRLLEPEAGHDEEVAASAEAIKPRENKEDEKVAASETRIGQAEVYVESGDEISEARVIAWDEEADRLFEEEEADEEDDEQDTKFFNVNLEREEASVGWKGHTPSKSTILHPPVKTEQGNVPPPDKTHAAATADTAQKPQLPAEYEERGILVVGVPASSKKRARSAAKNSRPARRQHREKKPKAKPQKNTVWLSKKVGRGALN
ncbi:hypothetical protein JQN58_14480 [Aneurinibacillus sp. BA2021]|nr:hypothetical protein [Aneurinibacillus sp. BA2021]